ncbi:MAG: YggS family pyridoxal phosphate-dependent enzyme [Paludibacteraceae bacterium]|nr:YggS family pyridoxal phosphate-dependent enzyme [Paludibacteraceae bacterium]
MTEIQQNLQKVLQSLPNEGVRLVAVSKFNPMTAIEEAYAVGQRLFGESHAQELVPKAQALPKDIQWHFIGHLQTNKVKQVVPYVSCIESVDSDRLLAEIDKQAAKIGRVVDCLLQFHVAREETKFGFGFDECCAMLQSERFASLRNVRITGIMGMASITGDETQLRSEFGRLKAYFDALKTRFFASEPAFCELSMGMTHDYPIAVGEGATLVRVGSGIFGERMYQH